MIELTTVMPGAIEITSVMPGPIAVTSTVYRAPVTFDQWLLDDNAANANVAGTPMNGSLVGGNTADVAATVNGYPAFHLDGASQYMQVNIDPVLMRADEYANLMPKSAANPVMGPTGGPEFGTITPNPAGGWWFFGGYGTGISRWSSSDLITWTGRTEVLSAPGAGAWDEHITTGCVFRKPNGTWVLTYRAYTGTNSYRVGLATSADGATFTRKDNGGVDDGLFPQFGTDYDAYAFILIGTTYYAYTNGTPDHGHTNLYISTDDFNTFTPYTNNPIFNNGFCPYVWQGSDSKYYIAIPRDLGGSGSTLYSHGIALYRSSDPHFDFGSREYLGYLVINDQSYDNAYLDLPSIPMTNIYRNVYSPDFGDNFNMIYSGYTSGQYLNLAVDTIANIESREAIPEEKSELRAHTPVSYSFWVQFDTLSTGEVVFSIAASPTASSPVEFGVIKGAYDLALYLAGGFRNTSINLVTGTPYLVVVVNDTVDHKVYINGTLGGTFAYLPTATNPTWLYIGRGAGGYLDGYVWDWRIYPWALTAGEVTNLIPPAYVSSQLTDLSTVAVQFSEELQATNALTGVTIKVNGASVTISTATIQTDKHYVNYVLAAAVNYADALTWEYNAAVGNIANLGGTVLADVAAQNVINPYGALWYLNGGVAAINCIGAYNPKGAGSLAASYVNLANPGTHDLTAGIAPTLNNGWVFGGTAWLRSDIIPDSLTWTGIVRYSGISDSTHGFFGVIFSNSKSFGARHVTGTVYGYQGGAASNAPAMLAGVFAIDGKNLYRNGTLEASAIPGGGTIPNAAIFIGGYNNGSDAITSRMTGVIEAIAFYDTVLTQAQVQAVSAAMAAL